jgi:hypothetical protein
LVDDRLVDARAVFTAGVGHMAIIAISEGVVNRRYHIARLRDAAGRVITTLFLAMGAGSHRLF